MFILDVKMMCLITGSLTQYNLLTLPRVRGSNAENSIITAGKPVLFLVGIGNLRMRHLLPV